MNAQGLAEGPAAASGRGDADARGVNVADLLTMQARSAPTAIAVIQRERSFSYAALETLVWALCRHLRAQGLQAGDVVGLHLQDPLVHLVALLALARSGMPSVALTLTAGSTEPGRELLARTGASAVIDADADAGAGWGLPRQLALDLPLLESLASGSAPHPPATGDGTSDDTLRVARPGQLLHYKTSSGTTGAPKIVGATHEGMLASIERETACIGYPVGERFLTPVSLRYDGPRRRTLACLAAGGTVVFCHDGDPAPSVLALIRRHDVRHFACVPSQAHALAALLPPGRQHFAQMRCLRLSAGPSDGPLHRLLRERVCSQLLISYGCTELGPMTVAPPDLVARLPNSVGRPMPGVEVQVVSDQDVPLPPDSVGQVRVRAVGMPQGYHDDPVASAQGFRDGWFYPGDLGRLDTEGRLFHLGRADGMMVVNGINIYPAEIEQAMVLHPAVREAVAMPLKHPVAHDLPVCAVVAQQGRDVGEGELLAFARRQLGTHRPQRVAVLPAIPRDEHGKVRRKALTEAVAAALAAAGPAAMRPLQQLTKRASIRFVPPTRPDLARLDGWLQDTLGLALADVDASPWPAGAAVDGTPAATQALAEAWMRRALLLARWLWQAARIPILDAPRLVHCQRGPDTGPWQAQLVLAHVEEMPEQAYGLGIDAALALNTWAMARTPDTATLQAFFRRVDEAALQRLKPMLRVGSSTLPVLRAAHRLSIPFLHLGVGVFQLGWGHRARRIERSVVGLDSFMGARLSRDKAAAAALLRRAGLPAPVHHNTRSVDEALAAARRLGWPVVVKPLDGERGEGVSVDVADERSLRSAFAAALARSVHKVVLVERLVPGVCHRIFIADGQLLYAVKRMPMSVQGDGVRTVAQLVDAEVAQQQRLPPWTRSGIVPLDDAARSTLAAAGLDAQTVPEAGRWVALRRIESTLDGGVDEEVTQQIHPENLRVALACAELFGLGMAGIDIISSDIAQPWFDNGAIVNEVNFAPLLGGAPISRSHLPTFLRRFIGGTGMIPVEVFVGGEAAWAAATRRWSALCGQGVKACLSNARQTLAPSGDPWRLQRDGLHARVRALIVSAQVQALVLVVQDDEFLHTGLPLEAVSTVTLVDDALTATGSDAAEDGRGPDPGAPPAAGTAAATPADRLAPARLAALRQLLQGWRRQGTEVG